MVEATAALQVSSKEAAAVEAAAALTGVSSSWKAAAVEAAATLPISSSSSATAAVDEAACYQLLKQRRSGNRLQQHQFIRFYLKAKH